MAKLPAPRVHPDSGGIHQRGAGRPQSPIPSAPKPSGKRAAKPSTTAGSGMGPKHSSRS